MNDNNIDSEPEKRKKEKEIALKEVAKEGRKWRYECLFISVRSPVLTLWIQTLTQLGLCFSVGSQFGLGV